MKKIIDLKKALKRFMVEETGWKFYHVFPKPSVAEPHLTPQNSLKGTLRATNPR